MSRAALAPPIPPREDDRIIHVGAARRTPRQSEASQEVLMDPPVFFRRVSLFPQNSRSLERAGTRGRLEGSHSIFRKSRRRHFLRTITKKYHEGSDTTRHYSRRRQPATRNLQLVEEVLPSTRVSPTAAAMNSYQHGAPLAAQALPLRYTDRLAEDCRRRPLSAKRALIVGLLLAVLGVTALAGRGPPRRSSSRNTVAWESSLRADVISPVVVLEAVASDEPPPAVAEGPPAPETSPTPKPPKPPKPEPPAISDQGTYDWQKCKESKDPDCWKNEGKRVDSYWTSFGKTMHDYWKGFGKAMANYWSKLRGGS